LIIWIQLLNLISVSFKAFGNKQNAAMKEFFSVQEVAKLLDISHSGVLYHIRSGKLKSNQVGKIYIISKEDFGDFLKKHREPKKKQKVTQTKLDL
jgi:excisionase family DNA binding protein